MSRVLLPAAPLLAPVLLLAVGVAAVAGLAQLPPSSVRLAGFTTTLEGRTPNQRHNAVLAANSLHGAVIPAGGEFSFNRRVRSWSADQGYVRAPVSYDGELIPAFGGGVCQTSTTLYNAALLSGLDPLERHHHTFAPHYIAPGRDAAVAYPSIDLRLRNPYPFPVRIQARASGERLTVELWGKSVPHPFVAPRVSLSSHILSATAPERITRRVSASERSPRFGRRSGNAGFRVVTYRTVNETGKIRRERLTDDSYPALPESVRIAE